MWRRIIPKSTTYILFNTTFSSMANELCETPEAIEEADEVCSRLMSLVSQVDIEYYDYTINLEIRYKIYLAKKLYKTSTAFLTKLLIMKKKKGEEFGYKYLIQQELLGAMDSREADNAFKAIQAFENGEENKRRVMFYCRGWMTGGVERVLINLLPGLVDKYKVILISDTSGVGKELLAHIIEKRISLIYILI